MKVAIIGLGLIGGSLAKALQKKGIRILGEDLNKVVEEYAIMSNIIDEPLGDNIDECDYIFLALPIEESIKWLKEKGRCIKRNALVIDTAGIKKRICQIGFSLGRKYDFYFVGGHPMGGKQLGGLKYSDKNIFEGAPFVSVLEDKNDLSLLLRIKNILRLCGFGQIKVMTAEEHDRIISYTSQMPHLISNAFIKNSTITKEDALISAGSFKDLTRVAFLDEKMWAKLFMENRENLLEDLGVFIKSLQDYKTALEKEDYSTLEALLREGSKKKEEVNRYAAKKYRT